MSRRRATAAYDYEIDVELMILFIHPIESYIVEPSITNDIENILSDIHDDLEDECDLNDLTILYEDTDDTIDEVILDKEGYFLTFNILGAPSYYDAKTLILARRLKELNDLHIELKEELKRNSKFPKA